MPIPLRLTLTAGPVLERSCWRIDRHFSVAANWCWPKREFRASTIIEAGVDGSTLGDCRTPLGTRLNGLGLAHDIRAALHVADVIAIGAWRFRIGLDA